MNSGGVRACLSPGKRAGLPGLVLMFSAFAAAQILPPGQLPSKPPQPGELGPAPANRPGAQSSPQSATNQPTNSDPAAIRVPVHYVLVPTTVIDKDNGNYINGLSATDFQLLDNSKTQKI